MTIAGAPRAATGTAEDIEQVLISEGELAGRVGSLADELREKLNLVKPGDRPLLVLPAGIELATVAGPPPGADRARPLAELGRAADWHALFFGSR